MTLIFDCDNVLADDEWRIRTIDFETEDLDERYELYHLLSIHDEPCNQHLVDHKRHTIAVFTAMGERYRPLRERWFKKHNIHFDLLYMRADDDHRPSFVVKQDMLSKLLCEANLRLESIAAAYDDRPDIVRMYKMNRVPGIHLRIHDKCAWTRPQQEKLHGL